MQTDRYQTLLALSEKYNRPPSSYFDDLTDYEAYCFDEASWSVIHSLKEGKALIKKKAYKSFSDFYSK